MVAPVWMDGSLEGGTLEVSESTVEAGMYQSVLDEVYTFALVEVFQRRLVVASVQTSPLSFDVLFAKLMTPEAQRAVQR